MNKKLRVATYNLYARNVRNNPEVVKNDIKTFMEDFDVLIVQEAGSARKILEWADANLPVNVYMGRGLKWQNSTAIVYRASLGKVYASKTVKLTNVTNVGRAGAGPNKMATKYLNLIKIKFNGRWVWLGVLHTTPSIYIASRMRLAVSQITNTARAIRFLPGIKIVGGDLNSLPGHKVRLPLERLANMLSSQKVLGIKSTHEDRSIDDLYYTNDKKRIIPISSVVLDGASDHHLYGVEFEVTQRIPPVK